MKKSILGFMSIMTLVANAQVSDGVRNVDNTTFRAIQQERMAVASESRWLSYAAQIQFLEYGDDVPPANEFIARAVYTAPDSLMFYSPDNSVWRHALGEVIDPSNEEWEYLDVFDNAFTVDSIAVDYVYERFASDGTAADTMEIVLIKDMSDLGTITWPGNDQTRIPYTANSDLSNYGGITPAYVNEIIKVPLTDSDTTEGLSIGTIVRGFSSSHNYSAGDFIGASVRFIPGYNYSLNDSLFNHNNLGIISIKENASNTTGAEYSDSLNYNKSMILSRTARYQVYTGTQSFLNSTFLVDDRAALPQHHSISFKVSSPNVGIEGFDAIGATVYPNPTAGVIKIDTDVEQTEVQIFNMLGQEVVSVIETGNFTVDITDKKAGIYFVTIKNNRGTATSKIVKK